MKKVLNYINGAYCDPFTEDWLDNYNPSSGEVYSKIANSSSVDVEKAFIAAKNAFPSWSNTTVEKRSSILLKIASLIEENLSLSNYIRKLKVPLKKVAIELNQEIIDKNKVSRIKLKNNDNIEIVHFIGGG